MSKDTSFEQGKAFFFDDNDEDAQAQTISSLFLLFRR
jgi:hypothetical protein